MLLIFNKIEVVLSFFLQYKLGITTNPFENPPEYSLDQMNAMIESLITNNYINTNKSINFPIRAIYAGIYLIT